MTVSIKLKQLFIRPLGCNHELIAVEVVKIVGMVIEFSHFDIVI